MFVAPSERPCKGARSDWTTTSRTRLTNWLKPCRYIHRYQGETRDGDGLLRLSAGRSGISTSDGSTHLDERVVRETPSRRR